jgi:hypothetical protein
VSLGAAAEAFRRVMGAEGTEGADYPAAVQARLDAGFTPDEVKTATELAAAAQAAARPATV